jgi:hypothetical protein
MIDLSTREGNLLLKFCVCNIYIISIFFTSLTPYIIASLARKFLYDLGKEINTLGFACLVKLYPFLCLVTVTHFRQHIDVRGHFLWNVRVSLQQSVACVAPKLVIKMYFYLHLNHQQNRFVFYKSFYIFM